MLALKLLHVSKRGPRYTVYCLSILPIRIQWQQPIYNLKHKQISISFSAIALIHRVIQRVHTPLQWRHNGRDGVSNHQPHDCLLNRLFRHSGADQRKHQCSVSLAFVWGIHRWPVNSPHKGPVTRKMFQPFIRVQIKESIKAPHHWILWGESTGGFPSHRAYNAEGFFLLMTPSCKS